MRRLGFTTCVSLDGLPDLLRDFTAAGWQVYELDGTGVTDKLSLLAAARGVWPQPEALWAVNTWDAFYDNLTDALVHTPGAKVAFVWTHVERMLEAGGLQDLIEAASVFEATAQHLSACPPGDPVGVRFVTLLAGTGPNFPREEIDRQDL